MLSFIRTFLRREDGATAIEYGLIAALVSVAAVTALTTMGDSLTSMFSFVSTELSDSVTSSGAGSS